MNAIFQRCERCEVLRDKFSRVHPYFKYLIYLLALIAGVGFLVSAVIAGSIVFADEIYRLPICFSNKCFLRFYEYFSSAFTVAKSTLDLIGVVATVGAIFVGLLSYLSALRSSHFTNHVSHLTLFQGFFVEEIRKRDLLALSSFDVHKIYGLIYGGSRSGDMSVSGAYFSFIGSVNAVIGESNFRSFKASKGPFIYKDHQSRMIDVLALIGFDLQFMPKKDFYEIELQVFSLIDAISNSFCGGDARAKLDARMYR